MSMQFIDNTIDIMLLKENSALRTELDKALRRLAERDVMPPIFDKVIVARHKEDKFPHIELKIYL